MSRFNEGHRVYEKDPLNSIIPYIMIERNDCQNSITDSSDVTEAEELIHQLRKEGYASIGFLHLVIAAYVRTVSQRPKINRFVSGQKIYARNNILVSMVILKEMNIMADELSIKMEFKPTDTLIDVYHTIQNAIEKARTEEASDTTKLATFINAIPGLLKKFIVWFLKTMDYFGILPPAIKDATPFHTSMFITNMASLNIPPIRHHLYNFGNCPLFIALGAKRNECTLKKDGSVSSRKVIDYIINMDERLCGGAYFASALKIFRSNLTHPEGLLTPPEQVYEDR